MRINLSDVAMIEMLIEDNKSQEALKCLKSLAAKSRDNGIIDLTADELACHVRRLFNSTHISAERARYHAMSFEEKRDHAFLDTKNIIPNINAQIARACENGLYAIIVSLRRDRILEEDVPKLCEYYKTKGFYVEKKQRELEHRITISWVLTR